LRRTFPNSLLPSQPTLQPSYTKETPRKWVSKEKQEMAWRETLSAMRSVHRLARLILLEIGRRAMPRSQNVLGSMVQVLIGRVNS
jgi:hypothetical protein